MEETAGGGVVVTILTSEGSLVRTQLCPPAGQSVAGRVSGVLAAGDHKLPREWSESGLVAFAEVGRGLAVVLCRPVPGRGSADGSWFPGSRPPGPGARFCAC